MHDDRLALDHTLEHLPAAIAAMHTYRHFPFAVCMARTDNRHWESGLSIRLHQHSLTRDLVSRILPIRVCEGRAFCYDMLACRLVVGRCRTDEDILFRTAGEKLDVAFHLLRMESDKFTHRVESLLTQLGHDLIRMVIYVSCDEPYVLRKFRATIATVQQPQVMSLGCELSCDGTADGARPSDNKYFHSMSS